jgi:hypothetical protein
VVELTFHICNFRFKYIIEKEPCPDCKCYTRMLYATLRCAAVISGKFCKFPGKCYRIPEKP